MPITSASNPRLKQLRAALRAGSPDLRGRIRIEGPKLLREAIQSHLQIDEVFVSSSRRQDPEVVPLLRRIPGQPEIVEVSDRLFPSIASTESPQGLLALAALPVVPAETLLATATMLLVGCELQDPGNLGTLVRSAEAFGAEGVLLSRTSVNPSNDKVVRASAGSVFRVPCLGGFESVSLLRLLARNGFRVLAATPNATTDFRKADYQDRFALVLGNEGQGFSEEVLRFIQTQVRIPMAAAIESLNVSVAASIILCEAAHQRHKTSKR
jgi:TrmH family RNA methyltransferase